MTFFGYKVRHGSWDLLETRKNAIDAIPFPATTKDTQSFLRAALFFHHHIPDYSEWSAKLYEMAHDCWISEYEFKLKQNKIRDQNQKSEKNRCLWRIGLAKSAISAAD